MGAIFIYRKKDIANYIVAKECTHAAGEVVMHHHDNFFLEYDFEFAYVVEGRARHIVDGEVQELSAGDYVFLDYGVYHNYEIREGEHLRVINLIFDYRAVGILHPKMKYLSELAHYYQINPGMDNNRPITGYHFKDTADGRILQLFQKIQNELIVKGAGYFEIVKCWLIEIMIAGFRSYYGSRLSYSYSEDIEYIVMYISDYYMQSLSLSEFAEELNMSLPYLSQKFKRETGMNFLDYLHQRRVFESCRLIAGTEESIENIAGYVGYADSKSFREKFRKVMHMSPRQYKMNLR